MVRTVSSVNLLSGTNNGKSIVLPQQNSWTDPIMSPAIAPSMPQSVARFPLQGNYAGQFKFDMKLEEPGSPLKPKPEMNGPPPRFSYIAIWYFICHQLKHALTSSGTVAYLYAGGKPIFCTIA